MRSASTVSGPLLSVSTPASQQNRFAAVHLLTGQLLYFIVEGKSKVKEVFSQLSSYMISEGMQHIELFALAFILDEEYFFVDPESKLSKYSPKSWKSSSTFGLDQNGQPLLQLHLRVKFYVDTTKSLRDDITRQHYYLQLRKNIADRGGNPEDSDQNVLPLVALCLQADLGDYMADTDISSELLEQYLPQKVYKNNENKVKQTLCALHKGHKGISKTRAQAMFVQEAGLVHKSHLYRLQLKKSPSKQASANNSVWLAICTNGVRLYNESMTQALSYLFLWSNVVKLSFDRKKFELRPSNAEKLVYYTNSDDKSKRLVVLCQDTHEFCMGLYAKLLEVSLNNNTSDKTAFDGLKWANEKKSKSMSADNDSAIEEKKCENGSCKDNSASTADQETTRAVIKEKVANGSISSSVELGYSHTAQNSAMSELDYSVQSAQDSSDAYLMYRQPRARGATYVDNSNQSANTSSGVYTCASYSTASKDTASASYTTENCSSVDCNESDYKTAALVAAPQSMATADSASSACTVDGDEASVNTSGQMASGVDDCDGIGVGSGDDGTDELYDLSAAATSDSSYCIGGTATSTSADAVAPPPPPTSSSSSKCGESGCGNRCALDGYADAGVRDMGGGGSGRSRSGSVVSNSGSFRGDGSDPSESGRGALLSAAELSDLIVGRKSLQTPRKGYYPSRPTTSSTLDSDSDYVTLPPPMNFVTGAPSLSNLSLANFDCGTGTSAVHWDVRRSFDLLSNVVKFCNGGGCGSHHLHHHNQCVVNSNNYLDVHKSGAAFYHHIYPTAIASAVPPIIHARQPPPPPPPPRPKRFDLQLEQYKQQLQSDVDFVVYPLQDPAVSRQEYVDSKLSRGHHHQQLHRYFGRRDPPWYQANAHLFRSTPNVAAAVSPPPLPSSSSLSQHHHQFQKQPQQQHQQQQHHHHHHHHHISQPQQPPPLPPLPPHLRTSQDKRLLMSAAVAAARAADIAANMSRNLRMQAEELERQPPAVCRTYSHDDLLQTSAVAPAVPPKVMYRRRPPPPPPPVAELQKPAAAPAVVRSRRPTTVDATTSTATATTTATPPPSDPVNVLDIESLRVKSRNLDLPLISALCNDQTLLKQTNALSTENKSTQTVTTAVTTMSSSLAPTVSPQSAHQPSAYKPAYHTLCNEHRSSAGVRCTNGTPLFSSPPPPSFLSATASPNIVFATAVRTTVKSKPNQVVKTNNTNVV